MKETTGVLQAILLKQDTARLPASQWKQVCVNHSQFWKETEKLSLIAAGWTSFPLSMRIYTMENWCRYIFFYKYTCTIDNGHWQPISGEVSWKKSICKKEKNKINCTAKIIHFHSLLTILSSIVFLPISWQKITLLLLTCTLSHKGTMHGHGLQFFEKSSFSFSLFLQLCKKVFKISKKDMESSWKVLEFLVRKKVRTLEWVKRAQAGVAPCPVKLLKVKYISCSGKVYLGGSTPRITPT